MDMSRILATSDVVFKYLFGAKSSTELLRAFVNAVQRHAGMEEFSSLEIINPIGEREYYSAKPTIIDVKAKSPDGTVINLEVQVRSQAEYGERSLYYWAKSYSEQILESDNYKKLMPVVSVSVLNFNLFPDLLPYHTTFRLMEKDHPEVCLTDDCVMHYLELRKLPEGESSELADWLYALRHLDEQEGPMIVLLKKNHNLQELASRYHRFEKDSEARMIYEARMKQMRDESTWLEEAQEKGLTEGLKKGLQQGLEQGLQQGLEQARAELERAQERAKTEERIGIARKMRDAGVSPEQILAITGLSSDLY